MLILLCKASSLNTLQVQWIQNCAVHLFLKKKKCNLSHLFPLPHSALTTNLLQTEHTFPQVHYQLNPCIPVLLPSRLHSFKNSSLLLWHSDSHSQDPLLKPNFHPLVGVLSLPLDLQLGTNSLWLWLRQIPTHDSFKHQLSDFVYGEFSVFYG